MPCQALNKFKKNILDILFPRFCLGCGREGLYICKDCEIFLSEIEAVGHRMSTSHVQLPIVSVWEYEGIVEKAIQQIKFHGCYDIIEELMEKVFKKIEFNLPASPKTASRGGPEDTVITYVPMWSKKEKQRGFNQAKLIAQKIGEKTGKPVGELLEKARDNSSQVGLGPKERAENVKGVFCLSQTGIDSNSVLLVDDVYTTGATMNECAKVLKRAGVKNVYGFTISRKINI